MKRGETLAIFNVRLGIQNAPTDPPIHPFVKKFLSFLILLTELSSYGRKNI